MSQTNLLDVVKLHPTLFCAIDCYICIWETMCVPGHDLEIKMVYRVMTPWARGKDCNSFISDGAIYTWGRGPSSRTGAPAEEGRHRTKHITAGTASPGGGTVGFPVLTAEALLSSPGTQASCQAARRWTWDTVGKGSADQSSKELVGGLRPAWVLQARQQWEVLRSAQVPNLPSGQQFACLLS